MASNVTIHCRPGEPLALPSVCCYCMAPATETHPVYAWLRKVRVSRHVRMRRPYPIQMPYCAAHAANARRFRNFDHVATVLLFVVVAVLLAAIDLTLGQALRAINGALWWCSTVLVMALLAAGATSGYHLARRLLRGRYPALAGHFYRGSLGVWAYTERAYQAADGSGLVLVERFSFHNPAFAQRVAALHGVEARPADGAVQP
jgi:hypothetical protein